MRWTKFTSNRIWLTTPLHQTADGLQILFAVRQLDLLATELKPERRWPPQESVSMRPTKVSDRAATKKACLSFDQKTGSSKVLRSLRAKA